MKLHSCLRKSAGAALGLVAALLFIIFAVGLFLYYAGSLIGGNHELNRAADAGILSVAKQALVQPAVALNDPNLPGLGQLPYSDFSYQIPDQQINSTPAIDLLTYNRCVAQAVIVGLEAQKINTPTAMKHAQDVALAVQGIGQTLQNKFAQGTNNQFFDNTANANTLNMLGGNSTVSRQGNINQSYVASSRPSNIYFYWDVINPWDSHCLDAVQQNTATADPIPDQAKAKAGDQAFQGETVHYAAGYVPITLMAGSAYQSTYSFVPVNPQKTPHLIDKGRFDAATTPPTGLPWSPPNAFKAHAQANVNITATGRQASSNFVNAISCAMVGCGDQLPPPGGGPQDQPGRIPGGYIRLYNLPDMVQNHVLSLGPVPGSDATAAAAYDANQFVLNRSALGIISGHTIYLGTPISSDPTKVVFAFDGDGKAAFVYWITHKSEAAKILESGSNPLLKTICVGNIAGVHARLSDIAPITGYINTYSHVFDGETPINDMVTGKPVDPVLALTTVTGVAGSYLGETPPKPFDLNVPTDHKYWTWVEYLKYTVIHNFATHFNAGHYAMSASVDQLRTGMKYFNWFDGSGHQLRVSSPNNYRAQLNLGNLGLEIPSSSQFMTIGTPAQLMSEIDSVITHKGGYQSNQVTLAAMYGSIANQLRLVNPKWGVGDVQAAMASKPIAPNQCMWLLDDGNGKLILTDQQPAQEVFSQAEGVEFSDNNFNRAVPFLTWPGQYLDLNGYVINTQRDGSPTAYKADCNVEQQPWGRSSSSASPIQLVVGAGLFKATGYHNCLGQVNFFSTPAQNVSVNYSQPN